MGVRLDGYLSRDKQLWTRVTRRVLVETPDFAELRNQLSVFHPVLSRTSTAVLSWVNDVYARNSWYAWATFTGAVVGDLGVTIRVDPITAAHALQMISGREHAIPVAVLDADEAHRTRGPQRAR